MVTGYRGEEGRVEKGDVRVKISDCLGLKHIRCEYHKMKHCMIYFVGDIRGTVVARWTTGQQV